MKLFLKPKYVDYRYILTQVRKICGFFVILTVYRHTVFGFWYIEIYLVKVNKTYYARFDKEDLYKLSDAFLLEVFPNCLRQVGKKYLGIKFHKFIRQTNFVRSVNQANASKNRVYLQMKHEKRFLNMDILLKSLFQNQRKNNYLETLFWMNFLSRLAVQGSNNFFLFKLSVNSYHSFLHQVIYQKTISSGDSGQDLAIEVVLARVDAKKNRLLFSEKQRRFEYLLKNKSSLSLEGLNKY